MAINRNDTHIRAKSSTFLINTIIKYSLFQFNNALETSGIYINFLNSNTTILGSKFFNNSCAYNYKRCYSSQVVMFQHTTPMTQWPSDATISDCVFLNNDQIGLYSYFFIPSLKIRNVTFHGQVTAMFIFLNTDSAIENVTVTSSSSSAIVIDCNSLASIMLSDLKIYNNQGTGIVITNCGEIIFCGNNTIANNTASLDGGGMAIYGIGPFFIAPHATVLFSNNTAGRYGGGVYVQEKSSKLLLNYYSRCIIQEISRVNHIYFELNKAVVAGDDFYGGNFFHCMNNKWNYYELTPKRNNTVIALPENVPKSWNQPSSRSSKPFSVISSDPIAVCLCENDTVDCSKMTTINKQMYSGESFNVSIAVVGLGGGVNSGSFITTTSSGLELISDANDNFIAKKSCKTFVYTPKLTHPTNANATLNISDSLIPDGYLNISLTILPCPPGLVLDTVTRTCVCDSVLTHKVPGIRCDVSWMPHPIEYSENNWIGYYKPLNCTIAHSGCPFDYCVSSTAKFSLNESDLQCDYNRSGILCGKCRPGLSLMLGSNKCSKCSNDWLALVPVFAISGVLLVVILIALNLTVSVGSINGLLFYANIVKLNESVFFPQGNIPIMSQFIAWLNLDWGIEMCFYNGLDGYWKVMLQFVFPVYLWFLVIAIIIACRYSFRVSRLCGHNAVPVLATLILMSYTKVLRTVTKSLMINAIECGDARWKVWNVDGNIPYLSSKHVVLFGISLLFLFTGLVYTGLVFSSQWLQRYSGKCCKSTRDPVVKLKPLIDAYTGPYKDKYRFWTGLGLIVRILLTVTFTLTSESTPVLNNFFVSITILLVIPLGSRVYRNKYNAIAEIYSHINLFFLASTTTVSIDGTFISTTTLTEISITFEMLLFLSIIGVQCYTRGKDLFKRRKRRDDSSRYSQRNYGSFDDLRTHNNKVLQREILIFDDN